jgi:hypothetical protein
MHLIGRLYPVLAAALALASVSAFGHGAQIQIGITNDTLVTHGLFLNEPYQDSTDPARVYQIPMSARALGDANDGWYADPDHAVAPFAGPGIALLDNTFDAGSILRVWFLDGLKIWNGSAFVDPGAEQIQVSTVSTFLASSVTSDSGPYSSVALAGAVGGVSGDHKTLRWRLLGDGVSVNSASDDGVYRLEMQLSTDQAGIAPSLPYYFLFNKNASAEDQAAALSATVAVTPEPGCLGLMGMSAVALLGRRRKRASRAA